MTAAPQRLRIRVRGTVQGVGFRPFLYGLAAQHKLSGFVLNDGCGVIAEIEGMAIDAFMSALRRAPPPRARIDAIDILALPLAKETGFVIRETVAQDGGQTQAAPDAVTCAACLVELFDSASRFHLYPFVTCTDCGPRFSMTSAMPYDRANTSMAEFPPCQACRAEYADPQSRRFHAETIACPACGPRLSHTIGAIAAGLLDGKIIALKGLGGFHLVCDAFNDAAVKTLRRRKSRPHKPFAVMVASADAADMIGAPTPAECALLGDPAGPIVMIKARVGLSPSVAPALGHVGLMLPSAPVHHLIFRALAAESALRGRDPARPFALIATSGNPPGDPLVIDNATATQALAKIADMIVTHDRAIVTRTDDSVLAVIDTKKFFIRRARGFVPDPMDLGQDGPSVLGVGGHLKATLCVTRGREAFVSQHIGDLGSPATLGFYYQTARRLLKQLDVRPELTICDLHPDYASTRFAETTPTRLLRVQHHAAHLAAVAAEYHLHGPVLGLALDGHGHGEDGAAWGGELMVVHGARWRRLGHLQPIKMPGGERAAREPWRMGVAALSMLGRGDEAAHVFPGNDGAARLAAFLETAKGVPATTSMGRLFDAAAALLGICTHQTFEGQAAMELEALASAQPGPCRDYEIRAQNLDFSPLLRALLAPGLSPQDGASLFHRTLIAGLADWIAQNAAASAHTKILLGGGCFANRILAGGLIAALRARHLTPFLPSALPSNDGGLSFGQAAMGRAHLAGQTAPESDQPICA
jgi:hydrogenase maturation protein HypF